MPAKIAQTRRAVAASMIFWHNTDTRARQSKLSFHVWRSPSLRKIRSAAQLEFSAYCVSRMQNHLHSAVDLLSHWPMFLHTAKQSRRHLPQRAASGPNAALIRSQSPPAPLSSPPRTATAARRSAGGARIASTSGGTARRGCCPTCGASCTRPALPAPRRPAFSEPPPAPA